MLKLGGAIATHAATSWLQRRRSKNERALNLAEIAAVEFTSPIQKHKLESLIAQVTTEVAEQLASIIGPETDRLPDNEIAAALNAVENVLASIDLSDEAILALDANPELLARRVRGEFSRQPEIAALSSDSTALYDRALDQSCRYLIHIVRHLSSFPGRALPEVLARLSTQNEQLSEILNRVPKSSMLAPEGTDNDLEFRLRYLEEMETNLDKLELLGVPTLDQPPLALTVAYLSLTCSEESTVPAAPRRRLRRIGRTDRFDFIRGADGVSVETAIGRSPRVLLRGDAGSGKTTLLNWLAIQAAREHFQGDLADWNGLVPFIVTLRSHSDGVYPRPEELLEYAAPNSAGLMPPAWAHRHLESGHALLLVDGVDEVEGKHRPKVKAWLRGILDSFPDIRVVVTSRHGAADPLRLSQENFIAVNLEPMSQVNIEVFIERWHAAAAAASPHINAQARRRKMFSQLERPHIRELATSPLLCAMLCALNFSHRGDLPDNRMDVYEKALSMLIHLRDSERQVHGLLDSKTKEVILRDLAWRQTLGGKVESRHEEAVVHVGIKLKALPGVADEAAEILTHLIERSGVLRSPTHGRIDFVHRTFQEYLAAEEAVEQDYVDALIDHAHLDTWAQTIVMACGHANAVQKFRLLNGILDRADSGARVARGLRLLAAQCLETVRDLEPGTLERVENTIREHLVPPRSRPATQSLAAVGHQILRYLPASLENLSEAKAAATVRAAAQTGSVEAVHLLSGYAPDRRSKVQHELELGWAFFDPEIYVDKVLADSPLRDGKFRVAHERFLPYVRRLRNLRELSVHLWGYDQSGNADLQALEGVPSLVFLRAYNWDGEFNLTALQGHHHLRSLYLSAQTFSNVSALPRLANLKTLSLTQFGEAMDLSFLPEMGSLTDLEIETLADSAAARYISAVSTLTSLSIGNYDDDAISGIVDSSARQIQLWAPTETGFPASIERMAPNVRVLKLGGFDSPPLHRLGGLDLEELWLLSSTDLDLTSISKMESLRHVYIHRSGESPVDLAPLARMHIKLHVWDGQFINREALSPSVTLDS